MGKTKELKKILDRAIIEFFESTGQRGYQEKLIEPMLAEVDCFAASLGFGGDNMKGALTIVTTSEALGRTHPMREHALSFSEEDSRDWAGEMANQVLGNFKRLVAGYNQSIALSTPTILRGVQLKVLNTAKVDTIKLLFQIEDDPLVFLLQVTARIDISFEGEPTVENSDVLGGDTMMF